MCNYTEEVANQLNSLLEKNYDAEKGYRTASENAKNNNLTLYFEQKANERKNFTQDLKAEIKNFGKTPKQNGSLTGSVHRVWMNTKSFLSPETDEAMLEEALRGEKSALEEYDQVINSKEVLPKSTTLILENQRNMILKDAVNIKRLEDLK
ncbi:PA2169 family four-helix-bundle protein [Tenacibaculum piscium]|uniref:ferritin-like domain-containing protein n=1 Tax=Tenacibaculum piscium TaxID=1458515 RepID=UPI00187BB4F9|nr:PA2169 family four-helix-bundle protein [Tenacibaculum piscium]MBE7685658.1 PA2169 family four-helix-bundle protein [Tenacibaculum piscium]